MSTINTIVVFFLQVQLYTQAHGSMGLHKAQFGFIVSDVLGMKSNCLTAL